MISQLSPHLSPLTTTGSPSSYTANGKPSQGFIGNASEGGVSQEDVVTISPNGRQKALEKINSQGTGVLSGQKSNESEFNEQELLELQKLKRRDGEVRTHEQAHLATAGQYARGAASFTFARGPDGASYAVAGEVGIDLSKERNPEETIRKMQTVRRAALAPLSPSAADRSIAARASSMESQARQELLLQEQEQLLAGEKAPTDSQKGKTPPAENPPSNNHPSPAAFMVHRMLTAYSAMRKE